MRVVAVAAVCLLLLLLVPLIRLTLYAIPWYDDYNYGQFVKDFVDVERSIGSAFRGAVFCMKTQWYAWQGTFSSVFFYVPDAGGMGRTILFLGSRISDPDPYLFRMDADGGSGRKSVEE